jgi:hypothetical protein
LLPNYQSDVVRIYIADDEQWELLGQEVGWNQVEFEATEKLKAVSENITKNVWNHPSE